jgi:O-succinylbenzoic acid--CoA ligase
MIDLGSDANEILLNPRMPETTAQALRERLTAVEHLKGHVFLLTSGSTAASEADFKWVALSKAAILRSAQAANAAFGSDARDVWFHTLPGFHVGGLGIWVRAELSGARVVRPTYERWDPIQFRDETTVAGATLTSLVPTQVHDLVAAGLRSPASLRAILVGGGALSEGLYDAARGLGWPVLASYGLSETASQAATDPLDGPHRLRVLPHLEMATDADGRIKVRGGSLFSGYVLHGSRFLDPKDAEGWFTTEDYGTVEDGWLTVTGRLQDRIKIGGELSNLGLLRKVFDEEASRAGVVTGYALFALPDERLGHVVTLAVESKDPALPTAQAAFAERVLPFERIRIVREVGQIPRTDLGKVKWAELLALGS